ncbi:MAG: hypothetical protein M0Q41_13545 [Bacteroidales bacterium]|nr:hypothetical protein [Acholeplasmataceae bacterium]MCK9449981.1 hypothetical protein [Bacteroidales bacterium]
MRTVIKVTLLLLISLIGNNCCSSQVDNYDSTDSFVKFKELFQQIDLPIMWNRKDIGRFTMPSYGQKSSFMDIPIKFFSLIPKDITESYLTTNIRALYRLPSKDEIQLFFIVSDYMYDRYNEGELYSILTKIYLIGYDNSGKILFHKLIAGNEEDKWDKLFTFNLDYKFEIRDYELLDSTIKHPTGNHLVGLMNYTETVCEISGMEIVNCANKTIKGFFDPVPNGDYELVRIINEN